jgi:hypothetical protein
VFEPVAERRAGTEVLAGPFQQPGRGRAPGEHRRGEGVVGPGPLAHGESGLLRGDPEPADQRLLGDVGHLVAQSLAFGHPVAGDREPVEPVVELVAGRRQLDDLLGVGCLGVLPTRRPPALDLSEPAEREQDAQHHDQPAVGGDPGEQPGGEQRQQPEDGQHGAQSGRDTPCGAHGSPSSA